MQQLSKSGRLKIVLGCLIGLAVALPSFLEASTAKAYHKAGNAAAGNAQITVTFNPRNLAVCNDDATNAFWIDFTDGVAAASDDSTNIKIKGNTCVTFTFYDNNVLNEFIIGLITDAGTPAYRIFATR